MDLNWFTTVPGLLIVFGIVLLIIAIILFIIGNKKSKKENISTESTSTEVDNNIVTETPIETTTPEVAPVEVEQDIPTDSVNSTPVVDIQPDVQIQSETESKPEAEIQISEPAPVEISQEPAIVNEPEETTVSNDYNFEIPQPTTPVDIPVAEPTVYGGSNPAFDFAIPEAKPVSIYGGNDPLEKTQSIPKVEEHHAPYGGAVTEFNIEQPAPVEVPQEEVPTFTIPEIQPVNIEVEEPDVSVTEPVFEKPQFTVPEPVVVPQQVQEEKQIEEVEEL